MQTWIALFRGINVGGKNVIPMADLKRELEALKFQRIRTYIQSGNVVFESSLKRGEAMAKTISDRIEHHHGFRPQVLLLDGTELQEAISKNPFLAAASDPKTVHYFFLQSAPTNADIRALDAAKSDTECYALSDRVFYLYAPDGVGRSKLARNAEKYLGVVTTARNYRTVEKLAAMVAQS